MIADGVRAGAVVAACIAQIGLSYLPGSLGFEQTIGDRSDAVSTLLTPPGYAFAIWGPLFLGCLVFAIVHAVPRNLGMPLFRKTGWFVAAAFAANAVWVVYVPAIGLDAGAYALLLVILALLMVVVAIVRRDTAADRTGRLAFLPILALAGWISAATTVGASQTLLPAGASVPSLIAVLVAGAAFAVAAAAYSAAVAFALAAAWGFATVGVSNLDGGNMVIGYTAAAAAVLTVAAAVIARIRADSRPAPGLE